MSSSSRSAARENSEAPCTYPESYDWDTGDTRTFKKGENVCLYYFRSYGDAEPSVHYAAKYIEPFPITLPGGRSAVFNHICKVTEPGYLKGVILRLPYNQVGKKGVHPGVKALFKTRFVNTRIANNNNNNTRRKKKLGAIPEALLSKISEGIGGGRNRKTRRRSKA